MRFLELLILFSILFAVISQQRGFEEEGGLGDENERRYVEDQTGDEEDDESYGSTEKSTGNENTPDAKFQKFGRRGVDGGTVKMEKNINTSNFAPVDVAMDQDVKQGSIVQGAFTREGEEKGKIL
eukprot:gene1764-533_t